MPLPLSSASRDAFRRARCPAFGQFADLVRRFALRCTTPAHLPAEGADVSTPDRQADLVELAELHAFEIHLDDSASTARSRCAGRTRCRSVTIRSDSATNQLAIGVPERPSTPAAWLGMIVRIRPFALNVVSTGAPSFSAKARSCRARRESAVADDDDRPLGACRSYRGPPRRPRPTADGDIADAPSRPVRFGGARLGLNVVGEDQVRHIALDDRRSCRPAPSVR